MRAKRLFENPDHVCLTGNYETQSKCADTDPITYLNGNAYPFGYYNDEMVLGREDEIHPNVVPGGRHLMEYPGRIWLDRHLISFWVYPNPGQIRKVLTDLEFAFKNGVYMVNGDRKKPGDTHWDDYDDPIQFEAIDVNIINNPKFRIEVLTEKPAEDPEGSSIGDWSRYGYMGSHHSKFISIKTYEYRNYAYQRSKKELNTNHNLSPMLKRKKLSFSGIGFNRYEKKKPLEYKQSIQTSEGFFYPSLEKFI